MQDAGASVKVKKMKADMKWLKMKRLSLEPDEHMKWIYDYKHPDYDTEMARYLRDRRSRALSTVPSWLFWDVFRKE